MVRSLLNLQTVYLPPHAVVFKIEDFLACAFGAFLKGTKRCHIRVRFGAKNRVAQYRCHSASHLWPGFQV